MPDAPAATTPASTDRDRLTERPVTVLLIDDQRIIGAAVQRMLADQPDIVFHYLADPLQAIAQARAVRPTVILQDLVMPQVDGLDLVATLRADPVTRDIPLIVLSSKEDPTIKAEAFARGANDYLVKLPDRLEVLARIRYHSAGYIAQLERNEALEKLALRNRFIRETFGRYLSDAVVDSLLDAPEGLRLGGEKREVTIMMSDLRGFTSLSERHDAEDIVALLNHYLGKMTEIILAHGGTIDEIIGDGIMVLFGAPQALPDHAERAVACALAMQQAMVDINAWIVARGMPAVEMGIGLNTGPVIVGNIGSERRSKYGAVGSHVNLAGRIESFTIGGQVLISASTRDAVAAPLSLGESWRIEAKGINEPIEIIAVTGIGAPWNLTLTDDAEPPQSLAQPVPLQWTVVRDKRAQGPSQNGTITHLSSNEAIIAGLTDISPRTDLQLQLASAPAIAFHGKTLTREPGQNDAWRVRFTAIPPEMTSELERLLPVAPAA